MRRTLVPLLLAGSLLAALAQEPPAAPARLALAVGDARRFERLTTVAFDAELREGALARRVKHRLELSATIALVVSALEPLRCGLAIEGLTLRETLDRGEGAREASWSLPVGAAPLALEAECDPRGRLVKLAGGTLKAQAIARGCPPELALIPQLYAFGLERNGRRADGPFLAPAPALRGDEAGPAWTCGVDLLYGTDGLLSELVGFHEAWTWTPRAAGPDTPPGALELQGVLSELKTVRFFHGPVLDVSQVTSAGTARLEATTGLPLACERRQAFTITCPPRGLRGRIERFDRLSALR